METPIPSFTGATTGAGAATQLAFLALLVLNLVAGFHALGNADVGRADDLPALAARM